MTERLCTLALGKSVLRGSKCLPKHVVENINMRVEVFPATSGIMCE